MNVALRRHLPIGLATVIAVALWACVLLASFDENGHPLLGLHLGAYGWAFGLPALIALAAIAIGAVPALLRPEVDAAIATLAIGLGFGAWLVLANDQAMTHLFPAVWTYLAALLFCAGSLEAARTFPTPEAPGGPASRLRWLGAVGLVSVAGYLWGGAAGAFALPLMVGLGVLALAATAGGLVWRARRAVDAHERAQVRLVLAGLTGAVALSLPVALVWLLGATVPPWLVDLALAGWLLFPLALAHALLAQDLIDVRTTLRHVLTQVALGAFLVSGYFSTLAALRVLARAVGESTDGDWAGACAAILIAVVFVPARYALALLVDRLLIRTRYDFREVVARVTRKSHTTLDMNDMKLQFMVAIDEALHPRFIYILTRREDGEVFMPMGLQATWGDVPVPVLQVLPEDPLLVRFAWDSDVDYEPGTGLTGALSPLAALGAHYRVPLQIGEEVVGLAILGPKRSGEAYSAEDRELLAATRLPLAAALKTAAMLDDRLFKDRMDQELRRAREVQEAMLPEALPVLAGFEFAASSVPCLEASGDYYDFVVLPDGRLAIAVADVAGKGIAAALTTAMVKSGLHMQAQTNPEATPMLSALNRLLHGSTRRGAGRSFTTCLYALIDGQAGTLAYACAGHFPPHHYNARTGRLTPFPLAGGFPLGVREATSYPTQRVRLSPGDVIVFYTDGVTEAQAPADLPPQGDIEPGEPFEAERLAQVITARRDGSALEIHDAIKQAITDFTGGQPLEDDITLVVVKVLPPALQETSP